MTHLHYVHHTTQNTQHVTHNMQYNTWNTPYETDATHNTPRMSWKTPGMKKNVQRCVANAATVIGVTGRHNVPEVVDLGTVRILTVPLPFTGYAS